MKYFRIPYILFIVLICLPNVGLCQFEDFGRLVEKFETIVKTENHREIITLGEKLKTEAKRNSIKIPEGYLLWVNNYLAIAYDNFSEYSSNLKLRQELLNCNDCLLPENIFYLCLFLTTISDSYSETGDIDFAIRLVDSSMALSKRSQLQQQYLFFDALRHKAKFYIKKGNFEEATIVFKQLTAFCDSATQINNNQKANSLSRVSHYLRENGKLVEAEKTLYSAFKLLTNTKDSSSQSFISILLDLADFYIEKGDYLSSQNFASRAVLIAEKHWYGDIFEVITNESLARICYDSKEPVKARSIMNKALNLKRRLFKTNEPPFLASVLTMALWVRDYDVPEFLRLNWQVLSVIDTLANPTIELFTAYSALANHYGMPEFKNLDSAIFYAKKEESKLIKSFGRGNLEYINLCSILGFIYSSKQLTDTALFYYNTGKNLSERLLGKDHESTRSFLMSISFALDKQGRRTESIKTLLEWNLSWKSYFKSNYLSLIGNIEKNEKMFENFEIFNSQIAALGFPSELVIQGFNNQLFFKSLLLKSEKSLKDEISHNPEAAHVYKRYIQLRTEAKNTDNLVEISKIEAELLTKSTAFKQLKYSQDFSFKDVQSTIENDEAIIDVGYYKYVYNRHKNEYSNRYFAFIVRKSDSLPRYVELCFEKDLDSIIHARGSVLSNLYKTDYQNKLFDYLFKPIVPYLNNIHKLFISPTGVLHNINFDLIPVDSNSVLGQLYDIHTVLSSAEISTSKGDSKFKQVVLYGGINYDSSSSTSSKTENVDNYQVNLKQNPATTTWSNLPGTLQEVKVITQLCKSKKIESKLFTGSSATERSFKFLDNGFPKILHVATHGFFLQSKDLSGARGLSIKTEASTDYKSQSSSMFQTGVILSGANLHWHKNVSVSDNDGILTSYEASQLNLSSCELLILSACESGLGQVTANEGVFGLQRGFKLAGVKRIILSLWKVPDEETAELFSLFYDELFAGRAPNKALLNAQLKIRKKYKDPYYWAAFKVIE